MNNRTISQRIGLIPARRLIAFLNALNRQVGLAELTNATKDDIVLALEHHVQAGIVTVEHIEQQCLNPQASAESAQPSPAAGPVIDPAIFGEAKATAEAAQAEVSRLNGNLSSAALDIERLKSKVAGIDIDGAIKPLNDALSQIQDRATQLEREIKSAREIKIPEADIRAEISRAVAEAFKPITDAVAQRPEAASFVVEAAESLPVGKGTAKQVFGVRVDDFRGNELEFDLYADPEAETPDQFFIWTPEIIRQLYLAQKGGNLWFGGEKGAGKSDTARQFAARTGRKYVRINFRQYTTTEDYIGSTGLENGSTGFKPGDFLKAYTRPGCVILLDEPSNTSPGELAPLNGLLEPNARVSIGGSVWLRGNGIVVIAADNTTGNGDVSGRYAGTRQQNTALIDRFSSVIPFTFLDRNIEIKAIQNHTGCSQALARKVVNILTVCRQKVASGDIVDAPSLRSAIYFVRALPVLGAEAAWATTIASRQPVESSVALEAIKTAELNAAEIEALI